MRVALTCVALLVVACDRPAPAPPPPPVAPPVAPSAPAEAAHPEAAHPQAPVQHDAPPPRPPPEVRRAARARLREARRLSHAGDDAAAWAIFEELIEASPDSPQLRCEGGFVAERAGHLDAAEAQLDAGLAILGPPERVLAPLRVTAATCLYNRGRVHEARQQWSNARQVYAASLSLRPNATVRRRLAALPDPEAWDHGLARYSTVPELVRAFQTNACAEAEYQGVAPRVSLLREAPAVAWIEVRCPEQDDLVSHELVAIPTEGGFALAEATTLWDGGRYYNLSGIERFEVDPIESLAVPEGAPWLRLGYVAETTFGQEYIPLTQPDGAEDAWVDCYLTSSTATTERAVVLCRGECRKLVTQLASRDVSADVECTDPDAEGEPEVEPPAWARAEEGADADRSADYELRLTITAASAELRTVSGTPPEAVRPLIGHPVSLDALFAVMQPLERFGDLR